MGFRDILPDDINLKEPVFIYFDGLPVPFFIESFTKKGNSKAIVRLTDICSMEDAEEVAGSAVFADIPGNPCIEVETENGEVMIPLHEDLILAVDPDNREIVLDIPEGLL